MSDDVTGVSLEYEKGFFSGLHQAASIAANYRYSDGWLTNFVLDAQGTRAGIKAAIRDFAGLTWIDELGSTPTPDALAPYQEHIRSRSQNSLPQKHESTTEYHCIERLEFVLAQDDWSFSERGKFLVSWGLEYRGFLADAIATTQSLEAELAQVKAERDALQLRIGDKVRVIGKYRDDWRGLDLWIAGVRIADNGKDLDFTISEKWPVPARYSLEYMGLTDGFTADELIKIDALINPKEPEQ